MTKSIAIIPARGEIKRIPKKNVKLFHGQPLIAYSIKTVQESGLFENIVVFSDDEQEYMIEALFEVLK